MRIEKIRNYSKPVEKVKVEEKPKKKNSIVNKKEEKLEVETIFTENMDNVSLDDVKSEE